MKSAIDVARKKKVEEEEEIEKEGQEQVEMEEEEETNVHHYKPPPEFTEAKTQALVDINLNDSTELWLIQWPLNQPPDFDGQEVSLKLHHDGHLGSFDDSSGKAYDVFSYGSQEPNATVFLSSGSGARVAGKISRRVSFRHYPEPKELEKVSTKNEKNMYMRSGSSMAHSSHHTATPSQGSIPRNSRSRPSSSTVTTGLRNSSRSSGSAISKHSSGQSSLSQLDSSPPPKSARKKVVRGSIGSMDRSTLDSERDHHAGTSSGSMGNSSIKSARKRKTEE